MTSEDALQIWRDSRSKDSRWRRSESGSKLEEAFQWTAADRKIFGDESSSKPARKTEASEKVLGTVELLEQILLLCHPRDLYRFQRVSTFWRDVASGSKSMKQAMWLSDTAMPLIPTPPWTSTRGPHEYSVAGMLINPCFKIEMEDPHDAFLEYTRFATDGILLVFELLCTDGQSLTFQSRPVQIRRSTRPSPTLASWRSMLLTSPPVRTVDVLETRPDPPQPVSFSPYLCGRARRFLRRPPPIPCLRTLFNPTGITFGDLYDGIESNILGLPYGTFISYHLRLQGTLSECQQLVTTGRDAAILQYQPVSQFATDSEVQQS